MMSFTYKLCFGMSFPDNEINLIKHWDKNILLEYIIKINWRLLPALEVQVDNSMNTQIKLLQNLIIDTNIIKKYVQKLDKYTTSKTDYPLIFIREGCLYAIEQIINCENINTVSHFTPTTVDCENLLKYLLVINEKILEMGKETESQMSIILEKSKNHTIQIEDFFAINLPLHERQTNINILWILYRANYMINYLMDSNKAKQYSKELFDYMEVTYGCEPKYFISFLLLSVASNKENINTPYLYNMKSGHQIFFEKLSTFHPNKDTKKLISIKKSPFIKNTELSFFAIDSYLIFEKAYDQLINDFWFDWLKNRGFDISDYKGVIGYFFEDYINHFFQKIFTSKYWKYLAFEKLKIKIKKSEIEIADIYLRQNNKIFLAQVKANPIYDKEKFSGNPEGVFKEKKDDFFKAFGVTQVLESIIHLNNYIYRIDNGITLKKQHFIYPCIILNDKSFQTPFVAEIFNNYFQEKLVDIKQKNPSFNWKKINIKPLVLLHISDIENISGELENNPSKFWELLELNHKGNKRAKGINPFYTDIFSLNIKPYKFTLINSFINDMKKKAFILFDTKFD